MTHIHQPKVQPSGQSNLSYILNSRAGGSSINVAARDLLQCAAFDTFHSLGPVHIIFWKTM